MRILIALSFFIIGTWGVQAQSSQVTITDQVLHEVDSLLFGQFMEKCSWGGEIGGDLAINPKTGIPDAAILEKLKAMNIPIIRYPGGTDVDYYSWTDLIDHAPGQTRRSPYRTWKDSGKNAIVSDNRLGLNEFLTLCEELEAEPLYVLNIGDAFYRKISLQEAKENAAAVYAYCNMEKVSHGPDWPEYRRKNGREEPFHVKYFQIGNETWGFKGLDWAVKDQDEELINHLYECIMAVADTLKALDPNVQIIADGVFPQMNDLFEQYARDRIDYLVFHSYQPWGINEVLKNGKSEVPSEDISTINTWNAWVATPFIDPETGISILPPGDISTQTALKSSFPIAVTEWNWNGWYAGNYGKATLAQPDLAKGLGAAGFLHAMMRTGDRIKLACQSMLVGQSWGITAIKADPDYEQEPVYYPSGQVTELYSNHHGNHLLEIDCDNVPRYNQPFNMNAIKPYSSVAYLDILATKSQDHLYLHVINRDFDKNHMIEVKLPKNLTVNPIYKRYTLSGDKEASIRNKNLEQISDITETTFHKRDGKMEVNVPVASVSVFEYKLE